jgi:NAD(P)-dependent dehydrogenase (short-subunit alcohol dehydrogenase family)
VDNLFSLSGRLILVTGGTRGIGRAISLRLARAGAKVVANYVRNSQAAEEMQQLAEDEGLSVTLCRADLTLKKGLETIDQVLSSPGDPLSGLVYCAATGVHHPFEDLTVRHLDWTFSLNVRSFFELVKLLLPRFADGSTIVALSSEGAVRAVPFYSVVGASKGALEALARHMARELTPKGIRVNILSPGSIMTDAWQVMPDGKQRIREIISRTPSGRLVTAEEVAWAAQFLCSTASSGIIGQTLVIDGGLGIVA